MPTRPPDDVTVLRALAHPVRNRILSELSARGSLRAADIARELDIPANQASFHLRQLAKYGLVEEDPDAGRDKRDRVWRAASEDGQDIHLESIEAQPGGKAASRVFRNQASAFGHRLVDRVYDDRRGEGTRRTVVDQAVRLTQDEAAELADELSETARRWLERTRGAEGERSTYSLFAMLQPYPSDDPHDPDGPTPLGSAEVPARLRRADPAEVRDALARVRAGEPDKADLRLLVKHYLAVLEERAPGHSVEVRVPPYAAVQVVPGVRHTRGTPPAVVETDAVTWIALASGELAWAEAGTRVSASGERTDLSAYLPLR